MFRKRTIKNKPGATFTIAANVRQSTDSNESTPKPSADGSGPPTLQLDDGGEIQPQQNEGSTESPSASESPLVPESSSGGRSNDLKNDSDEGEGEASVLKYVANVKLAQSLRVPKHGLQATTIGDTYQLKEDEVKGLAVAKSHIKRREDDYASGTKHEEEEEEPTDVAGLLDKSFAAQGLHTSAEAKDKFLDEYVSERMKDILPEENAKDEEEEAEEEDELTKAEKELYKMPEELKVEDKTDQHAQKMNWVMGLVEVPLPIEFRLKNIEATEEAKRRVLGVGSSTASEFEPPGRRGYNNRDRDRDRDNDRRRQDGQSSSNSLWMASSSGTECLSGPSSFPHAGGPSADADSIVRKAFGQRFQNPERPKSQQMATDDAALERFRKRFRRP